MTTKVLQLRCSTGFFGAENVILELAKGLRSTTDFHPVIGVLPNRYSAPDALADAARRHGIDTVEFPCRAGFDPAAIRMIRRYICAEDISVIHSHGYKADFYTWAASLGFRANTLATCHPWTEVQYNARARLYTALDKRLLGGFNRLVAVSETVQTELAQAGVPASRTSIIENGIDISRFGQTSQDRSRDMLGLPRQKFIVGTIGRLVHEKAHTLLLQAAKETLSLHPGLLFVIVGDGPLRESLRTQAENLGIADHLLFTGVSDRIPEMLSAFDVFVLSSTSEGLPMVVLEAMASRKPIITTGVGAIPGVVIHGSSGLVVRPDAAEISAAISFVVRNHTVAIRFAETAYNRVKQKYSADAMAQNYAALYRDMRRQNIN